MAQDRCRAEVPPIHTGGDAVHDVRSLSEGHGERRPCRVGSDARKGQQAVERCRDFAEPNDFVRELPQRGRSPNQPQGPDHHLDRRNACA